MTTVKNKHHRHNDFDLYGDVAKIKAALYEATEDAKGKAGELFTQSIDNVKERTGKMKKNVAQITAKKPFQTLGIVMLAGVAIGYLLRRK